MAVIGGDAPEYQIEINPDRMRLLDVSLDELLEAADGLNSMPVAVWYTSTVTSIIARPISTHRIAQRCRRQ